VPPPDDQLFGALARLSSVSFPDTSLDAVVRDVAGLAADLLGAPLAASVTLVRDERGSTVAASAPTAADVDEVQYRSGSGPCLDAARVGRPTGTWAARADGRWSHLVPELLGRGWQGLWSVPLPARRPVTGSLNLYLGRDGADVPDRWARTQEFARLAAPPLWNAHCHGEAVRLAGNLQRALESRSVIDQAKGVLMERYKITADRAFDVLVRISNDTNTKVRDVAETLVGTGELRGSTGVGPSRP
jgi:ANTAR domain/GAF domain